MTMPTKSKDFGNGKIHEAHVLRMKFFHDTFVDTNLIMSHFLSLETTMIVHRLVGTESGIKFRVRRGGLPVSEDSLEHITQNYKVVPQLILKLL